MSTVPAHVKCDYTGCQATDANSEGMTTWHHVFNSNREQAELDFCCYEHMASYFGGTTVSPPVKLRTLRHSGTGRKRALSDTDALAVIDAYTNGTPVVDLAQQYGVSDKTIYTTLKLAEE